MNTIINTKILIKIDNTVRENKLHLNKITSSVFLKIGPQIQVQIQGTEVAHTL